MKPWSRRALIGLSGGVGFILIILGLGWLFGARTVGDFATFGQFLVDLILMPAVVITFLITIYEFRKLQANPDVDLFLRPIEPDDGKPVFLKRRDTAKNKKH